MTYSVSTIDSEDTKRLAARLSPLLKGGDIIELTSDLGGGKTTFVQGLVAALGYTGEVTSPTFTLSQIYPLPKDREFHHYDLYRLSEGGIVGDELAEDLADPRFITAVEWAGIAHDILPADRLVVTLEPTSENGRDITFTAGGPRSRAILTKLQEASA
jgi:tRNA threonylcarbamoyladenosine biosynthesis protein TsaE